MKQRWQYPSTHKAGILNFALQFGHSVCKCNWWRS